MNDLESKALKCLLGDGSNTVGLVVDAITATNITVDDFIDPVARDIWTMGEKNAREGLQLDATLMIERFPAYRSIIYELAENSHVGVSHQVWSALHDAGTRRRHLDALRVIANILKDPGSSLASATLEAQKLLSQWEDTSSPVHWMDGSVLTLVDEVMAVQLGKVPPVLQTGLEAWDAVMGGLQPTLTMVGAATGVGKSALVAGIIRLMAGRGVKVGLISIEDEGAWLTRRITAHYSSIPVFNLAMTRLPGYQLPSLDKGAETAHGVLANVAVADRSPMTVDQVVSSARRMISMGCKAVFVDHLGEVSIDRTQRHDLDIADVLRELRTIAKVAKVPVVVIAHMKRSERKDGEPQLSDFAFSAGVERMARVAVGLWNDGDSVMCSVLKQTQGKSGVRFRLNVNKRAAIVIETPASDAAKSTYGDDDGGDGQ